MRSHARASSAGSNTRQAKGLGRIVRGAFVTRAGSSEVDGSGAPSHRRPRLQLIALFCLAIAAAMALTASPALAVKTHPYTGLSFGPDGTTSTSFSNPQGLAVDQSSGVVYVYAAGGGGKVYKFDAAGNPVNFSGLSGNVIEGVGGASNGEEELAVAPAGSPGSTAGDLYVANNSVVKIYSPGGAELGQLSGGETCGVATDPAGHVFVGVYPGTVREYIPAANPVTNADQSAASSASLSGICNVAADGLANVYATNYTGNGIAKLEGLADTTATTIEPGASTLAIDLSSNDLYADRGNEVAQYSVAGALINTFGAGRLTGSRGIAVNAGSGEIYANGSGGRVVVFGPLTIVPMVATTAATGIGVKKATLHGTVNPDGVAVTECKFEYGTTTAYGESTPCVGSIPTDSSDHAVSAALTGLLSNTTYHFRIAAKNANGANSSADGTFTTEKMTATETGTPLSGTEAELTGTVRPGGTPITECKFEYGESTSYGLTIGCAESSAQIGTGEEPVSVHAEVPSLQPSTHYHFRLLAKSETPPQSEAGADATFTTLGPLIESSSVDGGSITATSGTLEAQINPQGQDTSYHVEYVTQEEFEGSGFAGATTAPPGISGIGNGKSGVALSLQLSGLSPDAGYHVRFVATNVSGTVTGSDIVFATYPIQGITGSCSQNEQFRTGPSAALPECRAYEQVSPVDKDGSDIGTTTYGAEASSTGGAVTFVQRSPVPGAEFYSEFIVPYIAHRGAGSWSTRDFSPPPSFGARGGVTGWSEDLGMALTYSAFGRTPGAINFVRDDSDNSLTAITPYLTTEARFAGVSDDYSKIFLDSRGGLPVDTGPPPTSNQEQDDLYLYDRDTGQLSLAGILPDSACGSPPCVPAEGSFAGSYDWLEENLNRGGVRRLYLIRDQHAISASGDKVFFTAAGNGQLYMREGLTGSTPDTVQVNVSSDGTVDPNGTKPAIFLGATPSGAVAFFMSCQKLTDDSTAVSTSANTCTTSNQGQDLYAFDSASHEVSDLTVDSGDPLGAQVKGVVGTSKDGEYVYFVANGDFDDAGPAERGDCESLSLFANPGTCNLYLAHAGSITFIASVNSNPDGADWTPGAASFTPEPALGHVSGDGRTVLFQSSQLGTGAGLYRYNVDAGLSCVSCNPTGEPGGAFSFRAGNTTNHTASSSATFIADPVYVTRNLSTSGGRVFFQTSAKLVPADTNGDQSCPVNQADIGNGPACEDVYEWTPPGVGACVEGGPAYSSVNDGCLYLLSAGTGAYPSYFVDASASGDDAFILTRDQLVPQDKDQLQDIYDVRVGGGLASQRSVSLPSCEGEGCRGSGSAAPASVGAGTASFQGPGNPKPKPKKHKKHKRRHPKRSHVRTANHNRRAAR